MLWLKFSLFIFEKSLTQVTLARVQNAYSLQISERNTTFMRFSLGVIATKICGMSGKHPRKQVKDGAKTNVINVLGSRPKPLH